MQKPDLTAPLPASPAVRPGPIESNPRSPSQFRRFGFALAILLICFSFPLYQWFRFGLDRDLYSYTLLVPCITAYLIWIRKEKLSPSAPLLALATFFAVLGAATLVLFWFLTHSNPALAQSTRVALTTASFVLFFLAICALFLGKNAFRAAAFPLLFLIFMAPLPASWEHGFESFLQHGSADASHLLFKLCGTTLFRQGTIFQFPNITIEVAPECSGIRSTLVLFLTSLIAGHLFLKNTLNKAILTAVVIPLGIFRNMLRIFTISELCMHVSPDMIDSPIHHRGGPIFFAISLIPLFILMWYLRKRERQAKPTAV